MYSEGLPPNTTHFTQETITTTTPTAQQQQQQQQTQLSVPVTAVTTTTTAPLPPTISAAAGLDGGDVTGRISTVPTDTNTTITSNNSANTTNNSHIITQMKVESSLSGIQILPLSSQQAEPTTSTSSTAGTTTATTTTMLTAPQQQQQQQQLPPMPPAAIPIPVPLPVQSHSANGKKNVRENVLLIGPASSYRQITGRMVLENNPRRKVEEYPQIVVGSFKYRAKDALLKCPHGTGTLDRIFIKNDEVSIFLPKGYDITGTEELNQALVQQHSQPQQQQQQPQQQQEPSQAPQTTTTSSSTSTTAEGPLTIAQQTSAEATQSSQQQQQQQGQQQQQQQQQQQGYENGDKGADKVWIVVKKSRNGRSKLWRRNLSEIRPHLDFTTGGYFEETHAFTEICKVSKEAKIGHSSGGKEVYCTKVKLSDTGYVWVEFNFYRIFNFAFENFKPVDVSYSSIAFPRTTASTVSAASTVASTLPVHVLTSHTSTVNSLNPSIAATAAAAAAAAAAVVPSVGQHTTTTSAINENSVKQDPTTTEQQQQLLTLSGIMPHSMDAMQSVISAAAAAAASSSTAQITPSSEVGTNSVNSGIISETSIGGLKGGVQYPSASLPTIQDGTLEVFVQSQLPSLMFGGQQQQQQQQQHQHQHRHQQEHNRQLQSGKTKSDGPNTGYNQEESDALCNLYFLSKTNDGNKNEDVQCSSTTSASSSMEVVEEMPRQTVTDRGYVTSLHPVDNKDGDDKEK